jgi:hypothetical protein
MQVLEVDLVVSNAKRSFIVGYLLGIITAFKHSAATSDKALADGIDERLQEIYPLIEKEFYGERRKDESPPRPASWPMGRTAEDGSAH